MLGPNAPLEFGFYHDDAEERDGDPPISPVGLRGYITGLSVHHNQWETECQQIQGHFCFYGPQGSP